MSVREEEPGLLLEDDGFCPGLRPRGQEELLGDRPAATAVEELDLACGGLCDPPPAELLDDLSRRRREGRALRRRSGEASEPAAPDDARRLDEARREIGSFEPRNRHQAELKALLMAMTDLMRQRSGSGEGPGLEHWWGVVEIYRRLLASPQMASTEARRVLSQLLDLAPDLLTERRLEHVLGSRQPKRKSRRRRRRLSSRRQRRPHRRIHTRERSPK